MKLKTLFALIFSFVLLTGAYAQPILTANSQKSADTNLKIAKLDLLMKLLPLALTKDQCQDLEIVIAKARQKWRGQMEQEDADLASHASDISDALDAALNKGIYPSKEFQKSIADMNNNANIKEAILQSQLIDMIYDDVAKSFNAGQMKVMAGSYADSFIKPGAKAGDLKDDFKIKFFIQAVFMDPWAFELIGDLETKASTGGGKGG